MAQAIHQTRQHLIADGGMYNSPPLDARVERLEMAMQALTERLDKEDAFRSNYEQQTVERPGFQGE